MTVRLNGTARRQAKILFIFTFIPIKFVHPLRVKKIRNLTIFCTVLWSATTLKLVTTNSDINLFAEQKIVLLISF